MCCAILEAAFRFVDAAFNAEFRRAPRYSVQIHLGAWQSNTHIHMHALVPFQLYIDWMNRTQPERAADVQTRRPIYVVRTLAERTKYRKMDRRVAETALARSRAHSQFATLPLERVCGRIHKSLRVVLGARYLSTIEIHTTNHDVTTATGIDVLLRAVDAGTSDPYPGA